MRDNLELLHDRYARALFNCAEEDGTLDKAMEELEALSAEWLSYEEFAFLTHPLITQREKKAVIKELLGRKNYSRTMLYFLNVLIDNHRTDLIGGIYLRFKNLYTQFRNEVTICAESARPLKKEERDWLRDMLAEKLSSEEQKEKVNLEIKENPSLIGGIFLRFRDRIYDYSVRSQLMHLERSIAQ